MRKSIILFICLSLFVLSAGLNAEQIIGCSKGIAKGTFWPKLLLTIQNHTEKWFTASESMIDIEDGGKGWMDSTVYKLNLRMAYGFTHRFNMGVSLDYAWTDAKKINAMGTHMEFNEADLNKLWVSGQLLILDKHRAGFLEDVKLQIGAAYGFALNATEENLLAGIGPGVDELRIGPMWHFGLGSSGVEIAGHALYNWKGTAKEVKGWRRSGQNIADTFNYQLKCEYAPIEYLEVGCGLNGWFGVEEDGILANRDGSLNKGYMHSIMLHCMFFPMTDQYEKRKLFVIVNIPYAKKAMRATDISVSLGVMWTFYTE